MGKNSAVATPPPLNSSQTNGSTGRLRIYQPTTNQKTNADTAAQPTYCEATTNDGLEKSSRWMAVFNPASGKGSVCYLLKHPSDAVGWLQWTDAPGIYRKLRIMSFVDKIVPQGYNGTFQSAVGFFAARESDWENRALKRVDELKAFASKLKRP